MANPPRPPGSLVVGSDFPLLADAVAHAFSPWLPGERHLLAHHARPSWFSESASPQWDFGYYWPLCAREDDRPERVLWLLPRAEPSLQSLLSPLRWLVLRQCRPQLAPSRIGVAFPAASANEEKVWRRLGCIPVRLTLPALLRFRATDESPGFPELNLSPADMYRACVEQLIHHIENVFSGPFGVIKSLCTAIPADLELVAPELIDERKLIEDLKNRLGNGDTLSDELRHRWGSFKGDCHASLEKVRTQLTALAVLKATAPAVPQSGLALFVADAPGNAPLVAALEYLAPTLFVRKVRVCRVKPDEGERIRSLIDEHGPATLFLCPGQDASPGVVPLTPPPALKSLCKAVAAARPLSEPERARALSVFLDGPGRIRGHLHDRRNDLNRMLAFGEELGSFRDDLLLLSKADDAEFVGEMIKLAQTLSGPLQAMQDLLVQLKDRLEPNPSADPADDKPPEMAPPGRDRILAADDVPLSIIWLKTLKGLGYRVLVVTDPERIMEHLSDTNVFVCDMGWGDNPLEGEQIMKRVRAIDPHRLIVAISSATLEPQDAPTADDIVAGDDAKTPAGARRLHQAIWNKAKERTP